VPLLSGVNRIVNFQSLPPLRSRFFHLLSRLHQWSDRSNPEETNIHTKVRNRLSHETCTKLLTIKMNRNLISKPILSAKGDNLMRSKESRTFHRLKTFTSRNFTTLSIWLTMMTTRAKKVMKAEIRKKRRTCLLVYESEDEEEVELLILVIVPAPLD
jgi:hypothetical protein